MSKYVGVAYKKGAAYKSEYGRLQVCLFIFVITWLLFLFLGDVRAELINAQSQIAKLQSAIEHEQDRLLSAS